MISILIPIYNQSVVNLVQEFVSQCGKAKCRFEIICLDDVSQPQYHKINRAIQHLMGVNYVELTDHCGRAKIRNKLASLARFEHLLFIDSDSKIISKRYIKKYIAAIVDQPRAVISGGRTYPKKEPKRSIYKLHWRYGSNRESPKASRRNKRATELFHSNNFVVPRAVTTQYRFDESINTYGYEDVYWAHQVSAEHPIVHIDNPIKHGGLKSVEVYLEETKDALVNLCQLYQKDETINTRSLRTYRGLKKWGLLRPFVTVLNRRMERIVDNLKSNNPQLFQFDLFKLYYFAKCVSNSTK